jgi:hypothetical protein
MVKKKENLPIKKEDLHNDRWINTPYIYTKFGAEFTLLQQDIMLKVSEHLQDYLKVFFDEKRNEGDDDPKPLFSEYLLNNGIPPIRIPLSELNIGKEHYADIEKFEKNEKGEVVSKGGQIEAIRTLGIRKKYFDESDGKWHMKLINVFRSVDVPIGENGIRKEGFIELVVNTDVAAMAFNMAKGYTPHIKQIAQYSTKRTAPRIYLYLIREYSLGHMKVKVPMIELKEYMGMVVRNEEGEIVEVKYPQWPKFKQRVLDPSKEDVDRMASRNESEITFTYKPIYKGSKMRGNPDFVEFQIERSPLGERRDIMTHRKSSESKVIGWLVKQYNIDGTKLRKIITAVQPDELFADLCSYIYHDLKLLIEKKSFDLPDDQEAYITKVISNWIDNHRTDGHKQAVQQELFPEEVIEVKEELKVEPGEGAELWQRMLDDYDGPAKSLLQRVEYLGLRNGAFYIAITESDNKELESLSDELNDFYTAARNLLGLPRLAPPLVKDIRR